MIFQHWIWQFSTHVLGKQRLGNLGRGGTTCSASVCLTLIGYRMHIYCMCTPRCIGNEVGVMKRTLIFWNKLKKMMMMCCHPPVNKLWLPPLEAERCRGGGGGTERRGEVKDKEKVEWKMKVLGQQLWWRSNIVAILEGSSVSHYVAIFHEKLHSALYWTHWFLRKACS